VVLQVVERDLGVTFLLPKHLSSITDLNAVTRAIDLSCKILAPTVAGLIMSYSHVIAAIFIAVWNVVSVICEYALLRRVYKLVPKLAIKGATTGGKYYIDQLYIPLRW